jgi:streptogramin lyase
MLRYRQVLRLSQLRGRMVRLSLALAILLLGTPLTAPTYAVGPPFFLPTQNAFPGDITTGPDGNLWFVESGKIGRVSTAGSLTEFALTAGRSAKSITPGRDGNLWFTEPSAGRYGRITTAGDIKEFLLAGNSGYGTPINRPQSITTGPDGNLWFTQTIFSRQSLRTIGSNIDRINPDGSITQFPLPSGGTKSTTPAVDAIVSGSDRALWFTDTQQGRIWRITTAGTTAFFTMPHGSPGGLAAGPDGALWTTATSFGQVGDQVTRLTTAGVLTEHPVTADGTNGATLGRIASAAGNLWFTGYDMTTSRGSIYRATYRPTTGEFTLTRFPFPVTTEIDGLTAGPDGALWFTRTDNQSGQSAIDRMPST